MKLSLIKQWSQLYSNETSWQVTLQSVLFWYLVGTRRIKPSGFGVKRLWTAAYIMTLRAEVSIYPFPIVFWHEIWRKPKQITLIDCTSKCSMQPSHWGFIDSRKEQHFCFSVHIIKRDLAFLENVALSFYL